MADRVIIIIVAEIELLEAENNFSHKVENGIAATRKALSEYGPMMSLASLLDLDLSNEIQCAIMCVPTRDVDRECQTLGMT